MSTSLGPLFGSRDQGDVTGSITPRDGRFSNNMSDADWSLAKGAVQAAVEPKTSGPTGGSAMGQPTRWENPASGLKGAVMPVADAFVVDAATCRVFLATLVEGTDTHWYQGRACKAGEGWNLTNLGQWMPPREK